VIPTATPSGEWRLPALDVPVATYRGEFNDGAGGSTTAFDRSTLAALYPSHDAYVAKMRAATDAAVAAASCCRPTGTNGCSGWPPRRSVRSRPERSGGRRRNALIAC